MALEADTAVADTPVADTPVADTPVADTPVADTAAVAAAEPGIPEVHARPASVAAVVSSAGLAAALVFRHLGTKPLWLDETVSVSVARRPWTRLLSVLPHHDANAGLYYVVLHMWLRLGGGAAWTRAPSAAGFVVTAALAAWLGSRWRGPWFGTSCGLLFATNQFLLFYGQEARPYALAVMIAVASTAALFWRDGDPAPTAYLVLTVLLLYVDLFAVLFVAAQAAAVIAIHRYRRRELPQALVRCWAIIAAASAPLALLMITNERSQISWLTRPTMRYLGQTVTAMANGWLGLGVMTVLTVSGAAAVLASRQSNRQRDALVVGTLLASFALPPLTLWLFAQIVPSFIDRYVICSTVGIIGLGALGLEALRKRAAWVVSLAMLVLLAALGLTRIARLEREPFKYENPPAVVAFIRGQTQPGDAIGFAGGGLRTVVDAYLPPGAPFPEDVALPSSGRAGDEHDVYPREVDSARLALRLSGVVRLWLVTDPSNHRYPPFGPFAPLRRIIARGYEPTITGSFPGIDVTLYTRRNAGPAGR